MKITWMDKLTNKDIPERTGLPFSEENVNRQATKAGSLLSTVFWSYRERERALISGSRIASRET